MDGIDLEDNKDTALRIMDMKKLKNKIIFILVVFVITLTACGPVSYKHSYTIRTSYREWVKQIGLFSHKNLKVYRYNEERYSINIDLVYENDLAGYKELCDVIAAHNKFVDENPDYFPNDINIIFFNRNTSQTLSSYFNHSLDGSCDYSALEEPNTAKIQYMLINMDSAETEVRKSNDIEINVPIIILSCDDEENKLESADYYEFFDNLKNVEKVIIEYRNQNNDMDKICNIISEHVSDVEFYNRVFSRDGDYLVALQSAL